MDVTKKKKLICIWNPEINEHQNHGGKWSCREWFWTMCTCFSVCRAWGCMVMTMRTRSHGMWHHPCLEEIHVSEESPTSIFKAENSIFITSFHKGYVWQGMNKICMNTHLKLLTGSLKSCSTSQLFYSEEGEVGSCRRCHTCTTLHGDTHQIPIAFSTSNLTFKPIFNPKQKLNIKSQTNSFKTLPSSCVNDTDKWVLQYVKEHYK